MEGKKEKGMSLILALEKGGSQKVAHRHHGKERKGI